MKWVTEQGAPIEGVACPWLITRFIDEDAEFGFVPSDAVLSVAEREGAQSFGVPGADFSGGDGGSTFEALIDAHRLVTPGLDFLTRIVRAATHPEGPDQPAEAAGLRAIAAGFAIALESDVERQQYEWPVYDALLAWCAEQ